jgi:hypothetical protein
MGPRLTKEMADVSDEMAYLETVNFSKNYHRSLDIVHNPIGQTSVNGASPGC